MVETLLIDKDLDKKIENQDPYELMELDLDEQINSDELLDWEAGFLKGYHEEEESST